MPLPIKSVLSNMRRAALHKLALDSVTARAQLPDSSAETKASESAQRHERRQGFSGAEIAKNLVALRARSALRFHDALHFRDILWICRPFSEATKFARIRMPLSAASLTAGSARLVGFGIQHLRSAARVTGRSDLRSLALTCLAGSRNGSGRQGTNG
jgi:hypothetical protein